jgi:hypothetical protein
VSRLDELLSSLQTEPVTSSITSPPLAPVRLSTTLVAHLMPETVDLVLESTRPRPLGRGETIRARSRVTQAMAVLDAGADPPLTALLGARTGFGIDELDACDLLGVNLSALHALEAGDAHILYALPAERVAAYAARLQLPRGDFLRALFAIPPDPYGLQRRGSRVALDIDWLRHLAHALA